MMDRFVRDGPWFGGDTVGIREMRYALYHNKRF